MPSEYFQKKVISNWCQKFNFSNLTVAGNPQNNISTCLSCKGKLGNHKNHHFKSFIAKTNESIFHKGRKNLFWALLAPFSENEIFPEILGSVTYNPTWSSNFMHTIRKK